MTDLRAAAQQALEHVQEFKRRWMAVPPFGNKVNKATREAVTLAHVPVLQLEEALRAALEQPDQGGKTGWPPGLLQDDCRGLSKWLASQPDARRRVREAVAALEQPEQAIPYAIWRQGFDAVRKHKEDKHE